MSLQLLTTEDFPEAFANMQGNRKQKLAATQSFAIFWHVHSKILIQMVAMLHYALSQRFLLIHKVGQEIVLFSKICESACYITQLIWSAELAVCFDHVWLSYCSAHSWHPSKLEIFDQ